MSEPLIEVKHLTKEFTAQSGFFRRARHSTVRAVSDISFSIARGETFGLVGESGCGKSTLGRCIVRGIPATSGEVIYHTQDGRRVDFLNAKKKEYQSLRKDFQMIFQNPFSSLDPRMTVYDIISEPLKVPRLPEQGGNGRAGAGNRGKNGSERQLPEPVSACFFRRTAPTDRHRRALVTPAQTDRLRRSGVRPGCVHPGPDYQSAERFAEGISGDLPVYFPRPVHRGAHFRPGGGHVSGKIVELADTDALFSRPRHPYTEALLSAVPNPDPLQRKERIILKGDVPNPANPPKGCPFHTRCPYREKKCETEVPEWRQVGDGHHAACHFADELNLQGVPIHA